MRRDLDVSFVALRALSVHWSAAKGFLPEILSTADGMPAEAVEWEDIDVICSNCGDIRHDTAKLVTIDIFDVSFLRVSLYSWSGTNTGNTAERLLPHRHPA